MMVDELNDDGSLRQTHELPFNYSMMLPPFRGVEAIRGVDGLVNPRGFILIDKRQRNPNLSQCLWHWRLRCYSALGQNGRSGRCAEDGIFDRSSMVTATAQNIARLIAGKGMRRELGMPSA